jgi:hypothetical protein
MSPVTWGLHHRLLVLGAVVVVFVVGVAAVWLFVLRPSATPISLSTALREFQDQAHGRVNGGSGGLPAPGVYRYATTGSESINLPGDDRSFPSNTEMVVTGTRCETVAWDALIQHVERMLECPGPGGGVSATTWTETIDLGGLGQTSVTTCPKTMYLLPPHLVAGKRWSGTCREGSTRVRQVGQIVGEAGIRVGGAFVPAVHVRYLAWVHGSQSGTTTEDLWIAVPSGVIAKETEGVNVNQKVGPLGSVHYTEHMTASLRSLRPLV